MNEILNFYSRKDIQKELVRIAKDREVGVKFGEKGFGKRPDILQFEGDVLDLAKHGATSFHFSEERWYDPLQLKTGMNKRQLDELRKGWDFIIDIDCKELEYAKIMADLIVDALKFHDIDKISCKFSGNNGFHLGIPFESFSSDVNNMETRLLFPDGPRVIASYLKNMIKEHLSARLLAKDSIENIANKIGKRKLDLIEDGKFNPFKVAEIDTILISSRHMFRAPYSCHEKSGLVSIPIKVEDIMDFTKEQAKIENVKVQNNFLNEETNASQLIIQAFDWYTKQNSSLIKVEEKKNDTVYDEIKSKVSEEYFPYCIKKILRGGLEDGKKRSIFILINFLNHMGWSYEDIEKKLMDWNKTHLEPLRENYILAQIGWHKKQKDKILPPNCGNASYYKDLRFCDVSQCGNYKNPVNFVKIKLRDKKKEKKEN